MPHYSDAQIERILRETTTIALVGASANEMRPSHIVMKYLIGSGYLVVPVNPGMTGKEILGRRVYASLADVPGPIDMVDIFRKSDVTPGIVRAALDEKDRLGLKTIWMQLGVVNDEAEALAQDAGLSVIMDRCPKIEHARLCTDAG
jgi:predicted CoA-binding protein